jgi:hypothetical protein
VRKVTSEVSVSRRRRSPSAWSALPLKASLAQLQNLRPLYNELEPEAAASAWIEGGVGLKRGFVGPGARGFPGRGGVAATVGAWPRCLLAGPTPESCCRDREPG